MAVLGPYDFIIDILNSAKCLRSLCVFLFIDTGPTFYGTELCAAYLPMQSIKFSICDLLKSRNDDTNAKDQARPN